MYRLKGSLLLRAGFCVVNLMLAGFGLLLLVLAIVQLVHQHDGQEGWSAMSFTAVVGTVGVVFCSLGAVACQAAIQEHEGLLRCYQLAIFPVKTLLIFLILIYSVTNNSYSLEKDVLASLRGNSSQHQPALNILHYVQNTHACCGVHGPGDWETLPSSCCRVDQHGNTSCHGTHTRTHTGCLHRLRDMQALADMLFYCGMGSVILVITLTWGMAYFIARNIRTNAQNSYKRQHDFGSLIVT